MEYNLDFTQESWESHICKQYDNRIIKINLFDNSQPYDLSNKTLILNACNSKGNIIIQTEDILKFENQITIQLNEEMTKVDGPLLLELCIQDGTKQITTFTFKLTIKRSVLNQGNVDTPIYIDVIDILNDKITEATKVKLQTEKLIQTGGAATKGELQQVNAQLDTNVQDLFNRGVNLINFPKIIPEIYDSSRIQRAIDFIKTDEYTETIPTNGSKNLLIIPSGRYKIDKKIIVPSYIKIIGSGRNSTIFDSYITNGDAVFELCDDKNPIVNRAFYSSLEGFSINGQRNNTKGIRIYRTSRWILKDIIIDRTGNVGLDIYSGFLGEVYSCLIRACGDNNNYSVVLSGTNSASGGSHAVSFFGGEINGGTGALNGVYCEYGNSITFNSTTIEGFNTGVGVTVKNANNLMINGCYFELNKENIVEIGNTLGSVYTNNIFADLSLGARGHIGFTYAQGSKVSGNYFQGNSSIVKIFDATNDNTGKFHMGYIGCNYSTQFPINIQQSILDNSKNASVIETFNGNNSTRRYGNHEFYDIVDVLSDFRPLGGIKNLNGFTRTNIVAGTGTPEGKEIADSSSLYLREDGSVDTSLYMKKSGTNSMYGWLPIQCVHSGITSNRPTVTTVGYMYYDSSIGKPIWWNGVVWKDYDGITV